MSFLDSNYLNPEYLFNHAADFIVALWHYLTSADAAHMWKGLLFFFAMFFLTIICYTVIRLFEIRAKEHSHLHHEIVEYAHNQAEQEKRLKEEMGGSKNERWSKTLNYLFSQHGSDWKLAIIEADSMMESTRI